MVPLAVPNHSRSVSVRSASSHDGMYGSTRAVSSSDSHSSALTGKPNSGSRACWRSWTVASRVASPWWAARWRGRRSSGRLRGGRASARAMRRRRSRLRRSHTSSSVAPAVSSSTTTSCSSASSWSTASMLVGARPMTSATWLGTTGPVNRSHCARRSLSSDGAASSFDCRACEPPQARPTHSSPLCDRAQLETRQLAPGGCCQADQVVHRAHGDRARGGVKLFATTRWATASSRVKMSPSPSRSTAAIRRPTRPGNQESFRAQSSRSRGRGGHSRGRCAAACPRGAPPVRDPGAQTRGQGDLAQQVLADSPPAARLRRVVLVHEGVGLPPQHLAANGDGLSVWTWWTRSAVGPRRGARAGRRARTRPGGTPPCLQHQREVAVPGHPVEQLLGPLAVEPQGCAPAEPARGRSRAQPAASRKRAPKKPVPSRVARSILDAVRRHQVEWSSEAGRKGQRSTMQSSSWTISGRRPCRCHAADRAKPRGRLTRPPHMVWKMTWRWPSSRPQRCAPRPPGGGGGGCRWPLLSLSSRRSSAAAVAQVEIGARAHRGSRRRRGGARPARGRRPTLSERKHERSRSSARQKGAMADAGAAGDTKTSLWVMRWTRQVCTPRVKVSPTERSHTNSSSSSPSGAPLPSMRRW